MNNIIGKKVRFLFADGRCIDGVVKYQPLSSHDCWVIEASYLIISDPPRTMTTEFKTYYIKNFESIEIKKETTDEDR